MHYMASSGNNRHILLVRQTLFSTPGDKKEGYNGGDIYPAKAID
jgi:hypothetical protein